MDHVASPKVAPRLAFLALLSCGCPSAALVHAAPPEATSGLPPLGERDFEALTLDPSSLGSLDAGPLFERLASSSFAYYRFINPELTGLICERYAEEIRDEPMVNLHGDAHLEQYAVAVDGRGLADFDASTPGKPMVDFMRFATSLWLAADARQLDASRAVQAFFVGYRTALERADFEAPEPRVATAIRKSFKPPLEWIAQVEGFMEAPQDKVSEDATDRAGKEYIGVMARQNPDLGPGFFKPKRMGTLKMGIGSAREAKYLVRVEGETAAPDDDVFLEAKQVPSRPTAGCLDQPVAVPAAARIIEGQRRLSTGPQRFLGVFDFDERQFFIHAWRVNYTELSHTQIETNRDLEEIAFDVGVQLGHGHPKDIGDPKRNGLRPYLVTISERVEPTVATDARQLARLVTRAWQKSTAR